MNNFNPPVFFYTIPFTYFQRTRLKEIKDWIFHGWNEWLINLLILAMVTDFSIVESLKNFLAGYLAFISFYEIGYIANDFYAVKKENEPRLRFGNVSLGKTQILVWILVRVFIFISIGYYLKISVDWLIFYLGLGITFALHNILAQKSLKTFTFLQLAIFRFWAPVFYFLPKDKIAVLLPVVLFFYAFNRTLTYMDSKGLLRMPERTSVAFKLKSTALLFCFALFWAFFNQSWLCLVVSIYFLFFWVIVKMAGGKFISATE